MEYQNWLNIVPTSITKDPLWNIEAYRIALYLSDLCWQDIQIITNKNFFSLSDQLYRAVGSISANISEGFSRNSYKEKARFYEIALGSARESKDWYFKCRHILGEKLVYKRLTLLVSITKLLLTMINEKRNYK